MRTYESYWIRAVIWYCFYSSRRLHTSLQGDWSSDVCSSDLDSDFIAFVTRGPNKRKDYHINPGDEIFYQLEGELNLHYLKEDKHDVAVLGAGDLFLLPAKILHSPRRADGSWTFVIERRRGKQDIDRFICPCENCGTNLYVTEFRFDYPGDAVNRATISLKSDSTLAKCKKFGQVLDL